MRAIVLEETGGPEVLRVSEVVDPVPGPGEVLIDVEARGVNFIDIYQRSGQYDVPLPFVPGMEAAGTVAAVGEGVGDLSVGQRVGWAMAPGAYADRAVVKASLVVPVPEEVSPEQAAALLLQGMTAHYLVNSVHPVAGDETVLVHAAAGGTGLLVTQLAKERGARVIGTVSSEEKERVARAAGADEVVRYTEVPVAEAVRDLTGGAGVAAVYDGVGRDTFDASLASLRPRGVLALFGQSSGAVDPVDPQRLNAAGSVYLTRPSLAHFVADRSELLWRAGDLFSLVGAGRLDVRIGGRYPLADAGAAQADLASRRTTGKLVLV
ncbi:quinone oxidoreductase family protein [Nocardiopsis changdeensis]|uniref:Quinone oxidoreductase n=1 Tax=Nocardiopsis changdeensis TaxID=2831969 RepID=A0ABX8BPU6_9ACTN|nr:MULTISPECIES: quinone oxidoreductase [Nocardiopsis]QUX24181.1 quinone oxidoreductase [Nocardiopsis changdeensis]QYX34575.1 quinone oxidoreductase [Nocardiopsis sp. MT53]